MKRTLLILLLISQIGFCATYDANSRQNAFVALRNDNGNYYKKCMDIVENFKYDYKFSNHIRSTCTDFELERERLLSILYPNKSNSSQQYLDEKVKFSAKLNSEKINSYKFIVSEYCKRDNEALLKKDPQACKRADSLF